MSDDDESSLFIEESSLKILCWPKKFMKEAKQYCLSILSENLEHSFALSVIAFSRDLSDFRSFASFDISDVVMPLQLVKVARAE